jgi:hypothetical protein
MRLFGSGCFEPKSFDEACYQRWKPVLRIASREIVPDDVLLTPFFLECFVAYRKASVCFARVLKMFSWLFSLPLRSTISREVMRY